MPKHILFIVENSTVPRDPRVWHEVLAAREFGHIVSVICPADKIKDPSLQPKVEPDNGIRIYRHPRFIEGKTKSGLILEYIWALICEFMLSARIFITNPFQVIHSANPPDDIFIIALFFRLFGVRFIFDHHDITPENYYAKFGKKGFLHKILLWMERLTFHSASVVISTNSSYKQIAIERGNKRPEDVFIVRNGPDLSIIGCTRPNENLRNGFTYLVGYVGVIGKQENIENLLQTAEHIVKSMKRTDIKFIIVGTGTHLKELIRLTHEMEIHNIVQFTGYISDRELHEILSTVDVCVNPEFNNEFTDKSTMIKIMEYMLFGKPIVQFYTKEGEVTAGQSAIYVRENSPQVFAETLISLLEDKERRIQMGLVGRKRIEDSLNWDSQKHELRKAYDRIFSIKDSKG